MDMEPTNMGPTAFLLMPDPSRHFGPIPPSLAKKKNIEILEIRKVNREACWRGVGGEWGASKQAFTVCFKNAHSAYLLWGVVLLYKVKKTKCVNTGEEE